MKNIHQKSLLFGLLAFSLIFSSFAQAGTPISFEGPKITDKHMSIPGTPEMKFPENFTVADYTNANTRNDVVVPLFRPTPGPGGVVVGANGTFNALDIMGMDNQNTWSNPINQYFKQEYIYSQPNIVQVAFGQFGGGPKKDLVIVTQGGANGGGLYFCYEYTGTACTPGAISYLELGIQYPVGGTIDKAYHIIPIRVAIADLNGDGHDEIVGIGWSEASQGRQGYVFHVFVNNDANPVQKSGLETPRGIPLSLTVGNFDGSPGLDVAAGIMPSTGAADPAWITLSKNAAGNLGAPGLASAPISACYLPTGLTTWNPDANAAEDVVLTCYQRPAAAGNGPVITFKNSAAAPLFVPQQTIDKFKAPYESTVADYNGDGKADIAVADHGAMKIVVIAGGGADPFSFDLTSINPISTAPYTPKYIQTHQMDDNPASNDMLDIVSTASDIKIVDKMQSQTKRPAHAVLVLLNQRNTIEAEAGCKSVTIHCVATPGKTISECKFTTPEAWGATANAQLVANGTGKDLKLTVPDGTVHFTATSVQMPGNISGSKDFTLEVPSCSTSEGVGACPAAKLETTVYVNDPWTLCVPDNTVAQAISAAGNVGTQIVWTQTSGPNLFSLGMGSVLEQATTVSGNCMSGKFSFNNEDETVAEVQYSIVNTVTGNPLYQKCPAYIINKVANIQGGSEGAGGCKSSLLEAPVSSGTISLWSVLSSSLMGMYFLRRSKK